MANFFQNLKAGAQDLVGGVTGQQTGEMIELEWVCEAPALGLRLRKSETPQFLCAERDEVNAAIVEHLTPGSPAEASGVIAPGDVLVRVGGAPAGPYDEAVAALASAPRPVTITVRRRVARAEGHSVLGSVNFRLEEEIAKAAHILRAMLGAGAAAPPLWVLEKAKGFAFLRVVKLGFGLSARFGTGLVVARVGGGHADHDRARAVVAEELVVALETAADERRRRARSAAAAAAEERGPAAHGAEADGAHERLDHPGRVVRIGDDAAREVARERARAREALGRGDLHPPLAELARAAREAAEHEAAGRELRRHELELRALVRVDVDVLPMERERAARLAGRARRRRLVVVPAQHVRRKRGRGAVGITEHEPATAR